MQRAEVVILVPRHHNQEIVRQYRNVESHPDSMPGDVRRAEKTILAALGNRSSHFWPWAPVQPTTFPKRLVLFQGTRRLNRDAHTFERSLI